MGLTERIGRCVCDFTFLDGSSITGGKRRFSFSFPVQGDFLWWHFEDSRCCEASLMALELWDRDEGYDIDLTRYCVLWES